MIPATLPDHALFGIGLAHPFVASRPGCTVVGEVVEVAADHWLDLLTRLDEYEGGEYRRASCVAHSVERRIVATLYVAAHSVVLDPASIVPSGDWFDALD